MVEFKYLRHQLIDDYKNFMNKVDQADQLRSTYHCDHWTRTRKWWWTIWLWGVQVLLVNAYILYKHAHIYIWKTKPSQILTHFQFRRLVALHWLNPAHHPINTDGNKRKRDSASTLNTRSSSMVSNWTVRDFYWWGGGGGGKNKLERSTKKHKNKKFLNF